MIRFSVWLVSCYAHVFVLLLGRNCHGPAWDAMAHDMENGINYNHLAKETVRTTKTLSKTVSGDQISCIYWLIPDFLPPPLYNFYEALRFVPPWDGRS